jgi:23S rRNA (cytosine1962-C5)-methyltransferase
LRKDLSRHIRRGHPWIFAEAVVKPRDLSAGSIVDIIDQKGHFLARGYFDPNNDIAVRILTLDPNTQIDQHWFKCQVQSAFRLRQRCLDLQHTNAYRLINGEGDYLPGIVCDLYDNTAVLQFDCAAAQSFAPQLNDIIKDLIAPAAIYEKSGKDGHISYGSINNWHIPILEHGLKFSVNIRDGQKTGFFLDQRDNRNAVGRYCKDMRVLNCFAYTGGFSIYAHHYAAAHITSVDISEAALNNLQHNLALNGFSPERHRIERRDVFEFLKDEQEIRQKYDVIILDPPALAHKKRSLEHAERAYRDMNRLALDMLAPYGILVSCSCTARLDETKFMDILREAAMLAQRRLQFIEIRGHVPDHPINPALPEARYLKCLISCEM